MSKSLPSRPNLEQLKNQAKDLLKAHKAGKPDALDRIRKHYPERELKAGTAQSRLSLADAQLVVAREYGFASWAKLKAHVQSLTTENDPMRALAVAVKADDTGHAAEILERHPELKSRLDEAIPDYPFGATLLMAAVQQANRQMIDLLLRSGADINQKSHWWAGGFGVLDDSHGLASFLIERGAKVDAYAAARLGMLAELKEIVSGNPEAVKARGGDGQTPLHVAANVEVADFLLDHGADVDALDIDHESTPAQYALKERPEVVRRLVERGCRTDIFMAAALGDLELARKHLDADPESVRRSVSEEYFPKRDPRAGGSIYIWVLGSRKTPHQAAREFGHENVLRLLMDRSPAEVRLAQAYELGEEDMIRELLSREPDLVRGLVTRDRRRLADAAQSNNTKAVRLMLEAGWPLEARGQHDATALHWAAFHGNAAMAETLLGYHPPLECLDADFKGTPLGWAIHGSQHGWYCRTGDYERTVEALLRAGAKRPQKIGGSEAVQAVLSRFAG